MLLPQRQHNKRAAFTLMEIIAVVTIIMILAGVGVLGFNSIIAQQRERRAKVDCETIQKAAEIYQNQWGRLPDNLEVLANRQQDGNPALLPPEAMLDPWGGRYVYEPGNVHPTIGYPRVYTTAPTGKVISNW